MLTLQNGVSSSFELPDLAASLIPIDRRPLKCDLAFNLYEGPTTGSPQGIYGDIKYAVNLFDRSTVELIATDLECLLAEMVESPFRRI
jgi:hypothetical protein